MQANVVQQSTCWPTSIILGARGRDPLHDPVCVLIKNAKPAGEIVLTDGPDIHIVGEGLMRIAMRALLWRWVLQR